VNETLKYVRAVLGLLFVSFCLAIVLLPSQSLADDAEVLSNFDPPARPTEVEIDFLVINLPKIDVPSETFEVLAYMTLRWKDERALALLPRAGEKQTFLEGITRQKLSQIWYPNIQFTNQYYPRQIHNNMLTIERCTGSNGEETALVTYDERILITLQSELDFTNFPFDSQDFKIGLKTFGVSDEDVILNIGKIQFFKYESLGEPGDRLQDSVFSDYEKDRLPMEWEDEEISAVYRDIRSEVSGHQYRSIEIAISAQRDAGFYGWKILFPLFLIFAISCAAFWMPGEGIGTRMYVSMFGLLAVVTFSFYVNNYLPKMSDLTFLDGVIVGTYILITLSVLINISAHMLAKRQKQKSVDRIDRICRWAFPLVYGLYYMVGVLLIIAT